MPELPDPEDWQGFSAPHYTQVPDEVFDVWMPRLSGAELKVLLYICRRTFGFKKDQDNISIQQMTTGIKRRDGSTLDDGTGLTESTVKIAVKALLARRLIERQHNTAENGSSGAPTYRLVLRGGAENHTPQGPKITPSPADYRVPPGDQNSAPQETVQNTEIQEDTVPLVPLSTGHPALLPTEHESVRYSAWIGATITDYAREFGELANVKAHADRACSLWQQSGLSEDAFVERLHQAKAALGRGNGRRSMAALFERLQQGV